jgi:general secretion pathway protein I
MTRRAHSQAGFSLVEMLAALAVLAVAGLALMNAMTTGVRAAGLAQETALAGLAADNILALQIAREGGQALRARSGTYGLAGLDYEWRLSIEAAPGGRLDEVTLVLEHDGREAARRVTFVRRDP